MNLIYCRLLEKEGFFVDTANTIENRRNSSERTCMYATPASTMNSMDTTAPTASFSFEPVQSVAEVGKPFDIQVHIFSDSQPVVSTDIWIMYDPHLLQPVLPLTNTRIFDTTEAKIVSPGTLYLYGIRSDPGTAEPANGVISTLRFKPVKEGLAKLSFGCKPGTSTHSQIVKSEESLINIINCERTTAHSANITIQRPQVLGASERAESTLHMGYLTAVVALLMLAVSLYIRTRNVTKKIENNDL